MKNPSIQDLTPVIRAARRITVMTGAGVSAASGVPTFRGQDGLWRRHRAEELATPDAFARDPRLVWEWYDWRRTLIAACAPNAAHDVLARWSLRDGFTLITQNVDGLHERAGARVLRFHGSIWTLRCAAGCGAAPWDDRRAPLPDLPPRCPACGGLARPGVVWFGEGIDPDTMRRARAAAAGCDLPLHRHLVHRLPRRGARTRGQAPRRLHRRDQPGGDGRVRRGGCRDRDAGGGSVA